MIAYFENEKKIGLHFFNKPNVEHMLKTSQAFIDNFELDFETIQVLSKSNLHLYCKFLPVTKVINYYQIYAYSKH